MENWYILFVLQKDEEKIKSFLISKGLNAFIPKREIIFKRHGLKFLVSKPLFPNYVFIKSNLDQTAFSGLLTKFKQEKSGILRLLIYDKDGTPALNTEEQVFLNSMLNEDNIVVPSNGYLENQKVVIIDGPLIGYESKIKAVNKHKNYAKLLINIFDREIYIEAPLNIIKKIETS